MEAGSELLTKTYYVTACCGIIFRLMVLMFGFLAFLQIDEDHVLVLYPRDPSSWHSDYDLFELSDSQCFVLNHTAIGVQVDAKIAELKADILEVKINDPDECKGQGLCGTKCLDWRTCDCLKYEFEGAIVFSNTVIFCFVSYCILLLFKVAFLVAGFFEIKPWDTDMDWWGGWYMTLNNDMLVPLVKGWLTSVLPYMALSPIGGMDSFVVRPDWGWVGTERMYSHTIVRNDYVVILVLSIVCMVLFFVALGATKCCSGFSSIFGLFPWLFPIASIGMGIYLGAKSLTFPPGFHLHLMFKITLQVSFQAYVDAMQLMLFFMSAADAIGGLASLLNWFHQKNPADSPVLSVVAVR